MAGINLLGNYTSKDERDRLYSGLSQGEIMTPSGIQKVAYVALVVLLFGVATGWLGGL